MVEIGKGSGPLGGAESKPSDEGKPSLSAQHAIRIEPKRPVGDRPKPGMEKEAQGPPTVPDRPAIAAAEAKSPDAGKPVVVAPPVVVTTAGEGGGGRALAFLALVAVLFAAYALWAARSPETAPSFLKSLAGMVG